MLKNTFDCTMTSFDMLRMTWAKGDNHKKCHGELVEP
jgi:hypothetical protein